MDAERFSGLTAIVTGTGSGIGRATAARPAAEGARVAASDLVRERVEETVTQIAAAGATAAVGVAGDIADQAHVDALVAAAAGRVDVLVNCAGIMDAFVPVGELDDRLWARVPDVNLTAPMCTTRAALPLMIAAGAGSIVNVASAAGQHAGPPARLAQPRSTASSVAPDRRRSSTGVRASGATPFFPGSRPPLGRSSRCRCSVRSWRSSRR